MVVLAGLVAADSALGWGYWVYIVVWCREEVCTPLQDGPRLVERTGSLAALIVQIDLERH